MPKNFFSKINLKWRSYWAEFLGTFVFILVSLGALVENSLSGQLGVLGVAACGGLSYMAMVFATVGISGGHLNPAVSLSLWFARKLGSVDLLFYMLFQFLAGFLAYGAIFYIFGNGLDLALNTQIIGEGITLQRAILTEAIFSAVLVFVYFATMIDRRGPGSFGPFAVGLVVLFSSLLGPSLSGGVINPAKGAVISGLSGSYAELSFWIIGPFTGSLFALVYEFLFLRKVK